MPSYHDLKVGETLRLAGQGEVQVTLLAKSGRRARLAIEADAGVEIRPDPDADAPGVAVQAAVQGKKANDKAKAGAHQ